VGSRGFCRSRTRKGILFLPDRVSVLLLRLLEYLFEKYSKDELGRTDSKHVMISNNSLFPASGPTALEGVNLGLSVMFSLNPAKSRPPMPCNRGLILFACISARTICRSFAFPSRNRGFSPFHTSTTARMPFNTELTRKLGIKGMIVFSCLVATLLLI
jgi:hypothetical protein